MQLVQGANVSPIFPGVIQTSTATFPDSIGLFRGPTEFLSDSIDAAYSSVGVLKSVAFTGLDASGVTGIASGYKTLLSDGFPCVTCDKKDNLRLLFGDIAEFVGIFCNMVISDAIDALRAIDYHRISEDAIDVLSAIEYHQLSEEAFWTVHNTTNDFIIESAATLSPYLYDASIRRGAVMNAFGVSYNVTKGIASYLQPALVSTLKAGGNYAFSMYNSVTYESVANISKTAYQYSRSVNTTYLENISNIALTKSYLFVTNLPSPADMCRTVMGVSRFVYSIDYSGKYNKLSDKYDAYMKELLAPVDKIYEDLYSHITLGSGEVVRLDEIYLDPPFYVGHYLYIAFIELLFKPGYVYAFVAFCFFYQIHVIVTYSKRYTDVGIMDSYYD